MTPVQLAACGVPLMPCLPRSKMPLGPWTHLRDHVPTPDQIERWTHPARHYNLAAICGGPRHLGIVDFDVPGAFMNWFTTALTRGPDVQKVALGTYKVIPFRGVHVYVFTEEPTRNRILTDDRGNRIGDVRGDGGYALTVPSVHPNGTPYREYQDGPILTIGSIDQLFPNLMPEAAPTTRLGATADVYQASDDWPKTTFERIKERIPITTFLPPVAVSSYDARWAMCCCPLHDDASPSMRVDLRYGYANCYTGCTGGKPVDVIDLFCLLHGVSKPLALRTLAGMIDA